MHVLGVAPINFSSFFFDTVFTFWNIFRVFTLGIGYGVSTALVKGIAKNGGGKSEFIADKDRIQPKVVNL